MTVPQDVYIRRRRVCTRRLILPSSTPREGLTSTLTNTVTLRLPRLSLCRSQSRSVVPPWVDSQPAGLPIGKLYRATTQPNRIQHQPDLRSHSFRHPTQSTAPQNGKCIGITGRITAVDSAANSIAVTLASNGLVASSPSTATGPVTLPLSLSATLNSATQFQGIPSASSLTPGFCSIWTSRSNPTVRTSPHASKSRMGPPPMLPGEDSPRSFRPKLHFTDGNPAARRLPHALPEAMGPHTLREFYEVSDLGAISEPEYVALHRSLQCIEPRRWSRCLGWLHLHL